MLPAFFRAAVQYGDRRPSFLFCDIVMVAGRFNVGDFGSTSYWDDRYRLEDITALSALMHSFLFSLLNALDFAGKKGSNQDLNGTQVHCLAICKRKDVI